MERLPKNFKIKWTQGSKCFVEVTTLTRKGNLNSIEWHEDPENQQLSEDAILLWFRAAIRLALEKPDNTIVFLRCDLDSMPVTGNNRPFRHGNDVKVINWAGVIYRSRMG